MKKVVIILSILNSAVLGANIYGQEKNIDNSNVITTECGELKKLLEKEDRVWLNSWKKNPLSKIKKDTIYKVETLYRFFDVNAAIFIDPQKTEYSFKVYSPSKKYCVDIYSMSFSINKDLTLEGGDPDAAIVLYDFENHRCISLVNFGPDGYFDEVRWVSDTCFIVFGQYEDYPLIYIIDINKNIIKFYKSPPNKQKYFYVGEKFKKMGVIKGYATYFDF